MTDPLMSLDEAIETIRRTPQNASLVRDAYFDVDVTAAVHRFADSSEFAETLKLAGERANGVVLDVGAGRGISSYAFARAGARQVIALEPDPSDVVGLGALRQAIGDLPIEALAAYAEAIPLPNASCDLVYARQVLHHIPDLPAAMREVARVLKSGGMFLACREHVVDDDAQLASFLASHPVHQLAGGENAYRMDQYIGAMQNAGLRVQQIIRPWDSVITAFPGARSQAELNEGYVRSQRRRLRYPLRIGQYIPGVVSAVRRVHADPGYPGRMFAFVASKP